MAVGTTLSPHNVDNFVHPERTWYSSKIPNAHNQLRHMASAPNAHCIYFANTKDVYKIDTATKKRKHVTELPFAPKCTATGHGYFCAGDDHGYLAYVRIPEGATPLTRASESPLADLAAASQRLGYTSLLDDPSFLSQIFPSRTRIEKVGRDIVNSISIHRISPPCEGVDDDVIAVVTCNDKMVRTWSLSRDQEQLVDGFSQPMNHATVSPNGRRLVIVGDHNVAYFYRRQDIEDNLERLRHCTDRELAWYRWEQERMFQLPKAAQYDSLASFTTAWSETGKLCATASESGYISVFDMEAIADADDISDCLFTFAPSSRPESPAGAVRAMCFAPSPWDFLIWAENNGRICIGDLRSRLVVRQSVTLDSKAQDVKKVPLTDESSTQSNAFDDSNFDFEMEFIRQRQRQLGSDVDSFATVAPALHRRTNLASYQDAGLDEDERQILDNLRTSRERNEAHQAALRDLQGSSSQPTPRSISYLPGARNVDRQETRPTSEHGSHTPVPGTGSGRELARLRQDAAVLDTLRNYMRDTNDSRRNVSTSNPSAPGPRRRSSVVLSPPSGSNPSRLSEQQGSADPWRTIQDAIARVRDEDPETYASIARNAATSRARGDDPAHDPYLSLPPLMQTLGGNDSVNSSSDAVNVNLPSDNASRSASTATGVTLPSLRDPVGRTNIIESAAAASRARDSQLAAINPYSRLPTTFRDARMTPALLERYQQIVQQEDQPHEQGQDRVQAQQREREQVWRREALAARQYESGLQTGLTRRVGVAPALRFMNPQEAALHRRVYAMPANEAELVEWGVGTAGVMVPPLPEDTGGDAARDARMLAHGSRTLFVGTDEGIMELRLDFHTRKRFPGLEYR